MNKIKKVLAIAMIGTLAFSVVGCKMIQKTPEAIQKTVLAKVGDHKITKGDLDKITKPVLSQGAQQYGEGFESKPEFAEQIKGLKKQGIEVLVEEEIFMQKAKSLNLIPEQSELDKKVAEIIDPQKESVGGDEGFKKALEGMGVSEEEYKKSIERTVIRDLVTEDMTKDIKVTDEDVKKYYDENPNNFTGADVSHILIKDEAKAKEVRERAAKGEDFAALAKEFSEDPGSKEQGGTLGFTMYNTDKLYPEFVAGMNVLKEGEVSPLVQSQAGYHIIKATGLKVTPLEEVKDAAKDTIKGEQTNKIKTENLTKWKEELKVKIYEDKL